MSQPVRVMVADDQALVREGLMTLLESVPRIVQVAAATDGEEAVALCARHRPDVVLIDLRMPTTRRSRGRPRRFRPAEPETEVVVLTTHAETEGPRSSTPCRRARAAISAKDAGIAEISRAIHAATATPSRCCSTRGSCTGPPARYRFRDRRRQAAPAPARSP